MVDLIKKNDAIKAVASVDDYNDGIGFEVRNHCIRDIHLLPSVDCIPLNTKLSGREYYITVHKDNEGYVEWFEIEKVNEPKGEE